MREIEINGVPFQGIDFTDADVLQAFEDGRKEYMAKHNKATKLEPIEACRAMCAAVRDWADYVLGAGAGSEVLPKDSMEQALHVVNDMNAAVKNASDDLRAEAERMASAVEMPSKTNRQQRRMPVQQNRRGYYGGKHR